MQRLSVSSTPSCSSTGSGADDIESLGDLYVWGELWSDGGSADGEVVDILIPKALETDVVLDVHQISCGVRHVALVTRQGEVFTWGEELGGRLGHGTDRDISQPRLVDVLSVTNVDFVACGEHHTCAVSILGDLFTWGDGTLIPGLLGQGTDASHWIPKRVSGPLDGLQVLLIACGTSHSALITSSGRLFTFGDGKFGALGHGDRETVPYPKEVQQLSRMRTIKVACGVWHTAAIVEVRNSSGPGANILPRKLFTWGDGDKYRLGHGSKESYLLPTFVSALVDYNFHKIACGHTSTVALTTSGHVFTMGSNTFGQLGNPKAEGKTPCLVQDKLVGEFVEEIACGAYHVAVLTSRGEVFTWGKGANGRLGHGDVEDRKSPSLVDAMRDKHVKSIACGSSFTSSICIHKWVSGADQSVCSGCRQAFGFTRKRHNCYNCGLVHCHACSSKKALKAALAPTPNKPHRVCDACYNKLKSGGVGSGTNFSKKVTAPRRSIELSSRLDKDGLRSNRVLPTPSIEPVKYLEVKTRRVGDRNDSVTIIRASQVPSFRNLKDIAFPSSLSTLQSNKKATSSIPPAPMLPSRSTLASPYTRKFGPPSTATPLTSRAIVDGLKRSNEALSEEVAKLQNQIKTLRQNYKVQDEENQNLQQHAKEATAIASEQSSRCKVAKEVIKLITNQEMIEKIPSDVRESVGFKSMQMEIKSFLEENDTTISYRQPSLPEAEQNQNRSSVVIEANSVQHNTLADNHTSKLRKVLRFHQNNAFRDTTESCTGDNKDLSPEPLEPDMPQSSESTSLDTEPSAADNSEAEPSEGTDTKASTGRVERATEVIEQFEPGVYVTVIQLPNGAKIFKRVRFSKKKFFSRQAEEWWRGNKERVLKAYPPLQPGTRASSTSEDPTNASRQSGSISNEETNS